MANIDAGTRHARPIRGFAAWGRRFVGLNGGPGELASTGPV